MSLETFGYIKNLTATNPTSIDPKSEGDDHLRGIKSTLKAQFSGFTDGIAVTITETALNALPTRTTNLESAVDALPTLNEVFNSIYPVGSIYISTTATNPSSLFTGTTWNRMPFGRVLLNEDGAGGFALGATGGSINHTLTIPELPAHAHDILLPNGGEGASYGATQNLEGTVADVGNTSSVGSGTAFSIMPPYVVVYMWSRVS